MPAVIDLSLVAVGLGALVLLRLAGGSLPWGHLSIAVGPDGRPMRPRVKWHLWSVSRGEAPRLAGLAGFASVALGCASLAVTVPRIVQTVFHPIPGLASYALIVVTAICCVLVPVGFTVLVRAGLDLTARRSSMVGQVVGMRRDVGLFGPTYRIAVQAMRIREYMAALAAHGCVDVRRIDSRIVSWIAKTMSRGKLEPVTILAHKPAG